MTAADPMPNRDGESYTGKIKSFFFPRFSEFVYIIRGGRIRAVVVDMVAAAARGNPNPAAPPVRFKQKGGTRDLGRLCS